MAGLQRSTETFRRSGSSGLVWEDRHLPAEMDMKPKEEEVDSANIALRQCQSVGVIGMMRRTRSKGGGGGGGGGAKAYRTDQVAPAVDPPSPRVSCCGFCGDFSKSGGSTKAGKTRRR